MIQGMIIDIMLLLMPIEISLRITADKVIIAIKQLTLHFPHNHNRIDKRQNHPHIPEHGLPPINPSPSKPVPRQPHPILPPIKNHYHPIPNKNISF
jgi:hypothetical protein